MSGAATLLLGLALAGELPTQPFPTRLPPLPRPSSPPSPSAIQSPISSPSAPVLPRRPAVWITLAASAFSAGSALSFVTPTATRCSSPHGANPYGPKCNQLAMLGLIVSSVVFDAVAVTSSGFAGRGYGWLDSARRRADLTRDKAMLRAGIVLVAIGGAATLGSAFVPMFVGSTDPYGYPMIATRQGGVLVGATGAFLLGYAVSLRRRRSAGRIAFVPTLSSKQLGFAITWRG